jgi:hypothetical protein
MAGALVSQVNVAYNETNENVPSDQLARLGLAQNSSGLDNAAKAFGPWSDPQYSFVFTSTTAADTADSTLNLVTSIRTVIDPLASPSNLITRQIGPLAGALTAGVIRPFRFRVKQFTSNTVCDIYWIGGTIIGGATPVIRTNNGADSTTNVLGSRRANNDIVTLKAAAGSIVATFTHGTGNVALTWTCDLFIDDPL